jgi:hypothetical protein
LDRRPEQTGPVGIVVNHRWKGSLMADEAEIRPFRVDMPEDAIADLRRRIAATGWTSTSST